MLALGLACLSAILAAVIAQDAEALKLLLSTAQQLNPPTLYALVTLVALLALLLLSLGKSDAPSPSLECPATEWPAGKPARTHPQSYPSYDTSNAKESFLKVNEMLINEICEELPGGYEMPPREVQWIRDMLQYNVCGGKMNRGLMVVECGMEIFKAMDRPLTNESLVKFAVLGWCVEWLQAWLLVADDFMDDSQTRRGQLCWYLQPHVKKIALNDAFTIEMLVYKVPRTPGRVPGRT